MHKLRRGVFSVSPMVIWRELIGKYNLAVKLWCTKLEVHNPSFICILNYFICVKNNITIWYSTFCDQTNMSYKDFGFLWVFFKVFMKFKCLCLHISIFFLNILGFVKLLNEVIGLFGFRLLFPYVVWNTMATDMRIFAPSDEASPSKFNPVSTSQYLKQPRKLWTKIAHMGDIKIM